MRLTTGLLRTLVSPALVGLQALILISCEPIQPLLVSKPRMAPTDLRGLIAESQFGVHFITITTTDSSLASGQLTQATGVPKDYYGKPIPAAPVSWSISPANVATISATGLITAGTTAGNAIVSATADGVTRSLTITVAAPPPVTPPVSPPTAAIHMITLTTSPTAIKVGEVSQVTGVPKTITGTPIPNMPITWSVSPASVATISASGLVTAGGVGTATVFATADTITRTIAIAIGAASTTTPPPVTPPTQGPTGGSYGSATAAALPQLSVATAYPTVTRQVRVPAGANLQTAINAALPGDELRLAPGASYIGNFTLPNKGASNAWIVIRTDVPDAAIGAAGVRMTPSRASSAQLAKILTPNGNSTISTDLTGHHYRFTGVEIGATSAVGSLNALVRFGDASSAQNSLANTANNLILDRIYLHGSSALQLRRCLMLNSGSSAIVDSWLGECHSNLAESQAIVAWNGSGPYLIQNNYLEAGHEIIVFGGAGVTVPNQSPSDVTIRGNHITRPAAWKGVWQVKNLIETKHVRRLLVEGNVIENTWADAQAGFAFVLKSENQNGDTPWSQTTDVTIRFNRIRNVGSAINIAANPSGLPAVPAARFVITDNIIENVGASPYTGDGRTLQLIGGLSDIVAMHNTVVSANSGSSSMVTFASLPAIQRLVIHSNVLHHGAYGIKGGGTSAGIGSLNTYAPGALVTNNAIAFGGTAASYPANNYFLSSFSPLSFINQAIGDYRLGVSSLFLGKGYDGRDIGADVLQVLSQTQNAVVAP